MDGPDGMTLKPLRRRCDRAVISAVMWREWRTAPAEVEDLTLFAVDELNKEEVEMVATEFAAPIQASMWSIKGDSIRSKAPDLLCAKKVSRIGTFRMLVLELQLQNWRFELS